MSLILPINLEDLLYCRGVESERVEFKASWNPQTTGPQVLKTICAFANDFHNLNGGYVVIGVEEQEGRAVLPPSGLSTDEVELAQKWIRGNCNRMDPSYPPILSPETFRNVHLLVVWAPASEMRPHRAPDNSGGSGRYWVRQGSETVDAERRGDLLRGLMQQTARIPWDDRRATNAEVEDLREVKAREFLRDIRSGLLDEPDEIKIYRRMQITKKVNNHEIPRNIGLLLFSRDPTEWFRGAKIEVVQFAADRTGDVQEERIFGGALVDQLRGCLGYLENFSAFHLQKQRHRSQIRSWVSYPIPALRETLVNAVYHRGYDVDQPEPTKVYLYPDRIEIISYPGPVAGIETQHLLPNAEIRPVPARNRRIGEFLKELGLAEGRLTGLPKIFQSMENNGSPSPRFDFDEQRTYFRATLSAHPEYIALSALRDAAHLRALGESQEALLRIEAAWNSNHASAVLASEMIQVYAESGEFHRAEEVLNVFELKGAKSAIPHVVNTMIEVLVNAKEENKVRRLLQKLQSIPLSRDAVDTAILARRARLPRDAHRCFEMAGAAVYDDPRALHEFAQTKLDLARHAYKRRQRDLNRRFLREAQDLLERVIQLDTSHARRAWAWYNLGNTRYWLKYPAREVEEAFRRAIDLLPDEQRFRNGLERVLRVR